MKKLKFKRILSLLLACCMLFALSACSSGSSNGDSGGKKNPTASGDGDTVKPTVEQMDGDTLEDENLKYVLIYNPKVYDETKRSDRSALAAGSFGSQIEVDLHRADGLQEDPELVPYGQDVIVNPFQDAEMEMSRADALDSPDYKVGDTHEFYVGTERPGRNTEMLECLYSGEYCHVWTYNDSIDKAAAEKVGKEFDENIFETVTQAFGMPRFVGETGKVNLFFYPMSGGLMGFFHSADLYQEDEIRSCGADPADYNAGHAIVHINSVLTQNSKYETALYATLAHEFQHLINFTAMFETVNGDVMNTWLNEGMSGYIEEEIYDGAKEEEGHYDAYNESERVRNGQSLYNFGTDSDYSGYDIGVYGGVYYFSRYFEALAGSDVFSDVHKYWRESYSSTLSTAEALAKSVSDSVYKKIKGAFDFSSLDLDLSEDEEWMSKLTLSFYLATLSNKDGVEDFENINQFDLLFDSMDGGEIEGGGRLVVSLTEGVFEIPEDAEEGLIYIGLDENFEPIGMIVK